MIRTASLEFESMRPRISGNVKCLRLLPGFGKVGVIELLPEEEAQFKHLVFVEKTVAEPNDITREITMNSLTASYEDAVLAQTIVEQLAAMPEFTLEE